MEKVLRNQKMSDINKFAEIMNVFLNSNLEKTTGGQKRRRYVTGFSSLNKSSLGSEGDSYETRM